MIIYGADISGSLTVTGSVNIGGSLTANSVTGSFSGVATTASLAFTASSADSFTVRQSATASNMLLTGTLVAQTINVQQVTSSIVYSSGSNRFGNQLTDVQQMTGSLRVTGSGNHWIIGGNLGLGVTPSAWNTFYRAFEIGAIGSAFMSKANETNIYITANAYYDTSATWKYGYSDYASAYQQFSGEHRWFNTPSGIAGATVPFTQSMTLDSSGRLAIGRTSADHRLDVEGNVLVRNSLGNAIFYVAKETDNSGTIYQYNNGTLKNVFATTGSSYITGGNVGIGTTSPTNSKLLVAGTHVSGHAILGVVPVGNQIATIGLFNSSGTRKGLFYSDTGFVRLESDSDVIQIAPAGVLTLTASGSNVGIGTTSPSFKLHVEASDQVVFLGRSTQASAYTSLRLYNDQNSALRALEIDYFGSTAVGGERAEIFATGAYPLLFGTNNTARMYISGSGNVGIGTTSPGTKLEVSGAIRGGHFPINTTNSGEAWYGRASDRPLGTATFQLGGSSATNTWFEIVDRAWTKIPFRVSGQAPGESLIVSSSGYVGIGTETPANLLTVNRSADNTIHINTTTSGNGRFTIGTDSSANVLLRSQNSVDLRLGVDSSDYTIIKSTGNITLNSVVYNNTAAATVRTLYIGGDYVIGGVSSTRESKTNIENITDVNWLYELNPVSFNYRKKDTSGSYTEEYYEDKAYGLIAEDTVPVNDLLCNYNQKEDGSKELVGIEYPRLIVPLLKAIQELKAENTTLKSRIEQLETKIQ